jgi:hypothetical protein
MVNKSHNKVSQKSDQTKSSQSTNIQVGGDYKGDIKITNVKKTKKSNSQHYMRNYEVAPESFFIVQITKLLLWFYNSGNIGTYFTVGALVTFGSGTSIYLIMYKFQNTIETYWIIPLIFIIAFYIVSIKIWDFKKCPKCKTILSYKCIKSVVLGERKIKTQDGYDLETKFKNTYGCDNEECGFSQDKTEYNREEITTNYN